MNATMQEVFETFSRAARRTQSVHVDSTLRREPGTIIREVDGEVRFLAQYAGLMDYRAGRKIRVLRWRGQDCDEIVLVKFGKLRELADAGM